MKANIATDKKNIVAIEIGIPSAKPTDS